jgi:hypothetical protein
MGDGKELTLEQVETSRLAELADYQRRPKPTPTERAEAWARNHRDYEPPEGESE